MKLAIFVRKDLDMRTGKIAVQVGHASVLAYHRGTLTEYVDIEKWLAEGQKKIVLKAPDEDTLKRTEAQAKYLGVASIRVIDFGLTQIAPNTWTCLAVGPDEDAKIDEITAGFSLL
jgi:PTH2 family peptidyl-tRNA hydrolase